MRKPLLLLALCLLFVCPALAQNGTLEFQLRDAVREEWTGRGTVRVYAQDGSQQYSNYVYGQDSVSLPAGQYRVAVVAPPSEIQYFSLAWPGTVCEAADDACLRSGTLVTVAAGATVPIHFAMRTPYGAIRGRVVDDATGQPLSGAAVVFRDPQFGEVPGMTKADGTYLAYPLSATKDYWAWTFLEGWETTLSADVPVTPPQVSVAPDIRMKRLASGYVTGLVTDAQGAPLAGVKLYIISSVPPRRDYTVYAGADGRYKTPEVLTPDTYSVSVQAGGDWYSDEFERPAVKNVAVGNGGATADFTLRRWPRVTLNVTDAATGAPLDFYYGDTYFGGGSRTVNLAQAGDVKLQVYSRGYVSQMYPNLDCVVCDLTKAAAVHVEFDQTATANFALHRPSRITGKVVIASTGEPLGQVPVEVMLPNGMKVGEAVTRADGTYATQAFAGHEDYFVRARPGSGRADQWYAGIDCNNGCDIPRGAAVRGNNGADVPNIDFAVGAQPGIAAFYFEDAVTGDPLAGIGIELYASNGSLLLRSSSLSDAAGILRVTVGSGTYHARTFNSAGYIDVLGGNIPCGSSCDVTSGTPVVVSEASAAVTTLTMRRLAVTSIVPASGLVLGGDVVTIRGGGFDALTRVYLGSAEGTIVTRSDDTLTVRTPPHASGSVDLAIVNGAGLTELRTGAFTYRETCGRLQAVGTRNGTTLELHVTSPDAYEVQWFRGNNVSAAPLRTGGTTFNAPAAEGVYTARVTTACDRLDITFTFETTPQAPGRRRAARH
ncbi:MAG TPA: carboxypeptidase regulatory-like domain-containing protein [Thermoanaerobaculia bacterium]